MNRHEFIVRYSEAHIRRSTWAYVRLTLRRELNWGWWLAILAALMMWCWLLMYARNRVVVWLIPAIIGSFALFLVILWQSHIRHSLERLSRMKSPVASVVADEEKLSITSDLGSSITPWATFTDWLDGPEAIYLKAGRSAMINLPIDGVDERALQFIRERIAAQKLKG